MVRELLIAFGIVALCVVIHVGSIMFLAQFVLRRFPEFDGLSTTRQYLLLLFVVALVIGLHILETAIWAMFYYGRSLFPNFETALYFSLGTYSTIGYGDVVLPQRWRLLGGIEGLSGVLLCSLSGAFLFTVVNRLFQRRVQRVRHEKQRAQTI